MAAQHFAFAHDRRFALLLRPFGVTPERAWVRLDDTSLRVRFGRFHVSTPLTNVKDVQVTGPYQAYKALGPRMSAVDRGATYGTSAHGGVCVCFHEPVRALAPFVNPGLTLTVADVEGLAAAIRRRLG